MPSPTATVRGEAPSAAASPTTCRGTAVAARLSSRSRRAAMAQSDRDDQDRSAITDRARDERFSGDRNRGYDETVRRGPPLDVSVARGDYRPGRDELVGAGVRGYGEPGAYRQWGEPDYDERGGGAPFALRDRGVRGADGDYAPASDIPPGMGAASRGDWGRLGGWT